MKKIINKFLAVTMALLTALAVIPFYGVSVSHATKVNNSSNKSADNDVKYFSTTMYNFNKGLFNNATDEGKGKSENNFYFVNENTDSWAQGTGALNRANTFFAYTYNVLVQGIVKNRLTNDGKLQFNYKNAGVFESPEKQISGREVYQNVQFPFVKDANGYYEFNSSKNHVHVDKSKKNGQTLTLESGKQTVGSVSSFFPFNADGNYSPDYHFGMNMSIPFYINENGKDENNNPIKFEFSGDDDVWVFINGKLVLDLGGIHGAIDGSIDFSTGEVKYGFNKTNNVKVIKAGQTTQTDAASTTLQKLGIDMAELAKGENNLQIFYLERGAGESNCKIKFNLQQRDSLEVNKTLGSTTPHTDNNFEFQLLKQNQNGQYEPVGNKAYTLYTANNSIESNNYKTDKNGKFYLKAGQRVNFTSNQIGKYKVVELTGGYEKTWSGRKESIATGNISDNKNAYEIQISENDTKTATRYIVNCINSADVTLNDDTIVLDYGKTVRHNVRTNDNTSSQNASVYGIGSGDLAKNVESANGYSKLDTDVDLHNGKIKIDEDGVVKYTPTRFMNSVDKANYVVSYQVGNGNKQDTRYAYGTVNVLPATSVYYEDDFGTEDNTDSTVGIVWTGSWKKDGTSQGGNQGSENSKYGWDESYKGDAGYSNGSAHYTDERMASATFRFTGTEVDVYSRTNGNVGKIIARLKKVEKNSDGKETIKNLLTRSIDNLSVSGDYYQIPTLNFGDLEYGTYEVSIQVVPVVSGEKRGLYYLDGIRVYNPLGNVDANSVAGKAYSEAGESNAQYISVRKDLLDSTKVNDLEASINGSLFIDKSENKVGDKTEDIGTYKDYGPKNEVYVKENQGVAFKIKEYDLDNNKVFIGLKSPQGKDVKVKVTSGEHIQYINLSSAADLYYEITPDEDGHVVIQNMTDNLLSITKVRITSKNATTIKNSLISTPELMSYVEKFDSLSVKQDNNKDDSIGKDDIDIENPEDKNDAEDKNDEAVKPVSIWQKIIESIKIWFGK
ncbi:fibro-slime domain-containing protein [Intestinibacter bartlettii]|uniref:fibro-slime domain-containing protein n=1 Tax=Intestinibacter bartlettii TaxID=261299 RepID=UPI001D00D633|nr:fibro-slime domain-containing protein [Intestinibacter bartlettii]MCB5720679.1 fibro-slime domain-containing protein [Intestinibacter bartlettii]